MDFSGVFSSLDIVVRLMATELAIGCVCGLLVKLIVTTKARKELNTQIFSPDEYESVYFGKNLPKCTDLFLLPPEFIVVKFKDGAIVSEDFYNFFGGHTKVDFSYENGRMNPEWSFSLAPVFLCTILIPALLGLFLSIIQYFQPLLYSSLGWTLVSYVKNKLLKA